MENLVTIGAFAEAARVSPKALRLYAANGLLMPAHVDRDSGYRYYRPEQLPVARIIGLLRPRDLSQRAGRADALGGRLAARVLRRARTDLG